MKELHENLNENQKEAVFSTEGPLLILAGAGSGKTRVITHRIVHIIESGLAYPHRICALTFTNKAAGEMKERTISMLSRDPGEIQIRTFHSFCLFILRRHARELGFKNAFTVYDQEMQERLIKKILKEKNLDSKQIRPASVMQALNQSKDKGKGIDELEINAAGYYWKAIQSAAEEYEKRKKENQALDFSDLIYRTVVLFKTNPEILSLYAERFKYLLVDEYQDTNKIQYELVRLLASIHNNICVVGDDDQSIYSWRGATIKNILNFEKDFVGTKIIKLEENYRSTSVIIEAASSLIRNNHGRKDKNIFTKNQRGEKITLERFQNESEEALAIINHIKSLSADGIRLNSFAIFYRTNAQSRYFEEALRMRAIPYKVFGGFRFFDRAEVKDLMAYLSVLVNNSDSLSLSRIINTPVRGIGDTTVDKLNRESLDRGISLYEVLENPPDTLKKNAKTSLEQFRQKLSKWDAMMASGKKGSEIARDIIDTAGFRDFFLEENTVESVTRLENMEEFANAMEEYEESEENPTLAEFLNQVSLITSEQEKPEMQDFVTLMTVHNAKGLEYDIVFLTGMEEGTFPHFLSLEGNEGLEEERRLGYVAITRARKKIFISHSRFTRKFGPIEPRLPSRFLEELPAELIEEEKSNRYAIRKPESPPYIREMEMVKPKHIVLENKSTDGFVEGAKVRHKDFGIGKILEITGTGENMKVRVVFGNVEKKFFVAYTPLGLVSDIES